MKHYLELDFRTGLFYGYSGQEKAGYEEHTSGTGKVSYRKYYKKGIYGSLKSMYIKNDDRFGMQVRIILENGEEWFMLKMPIFSGQGRLDSFMESLIAFLPNMETGTSYRIYTYVLETQNSVGKDVTRRGTSVVEAELNGEGGGTPGAKVEKALHYLKKEDEYDPTDETAIPKLDFKKGLGDKFMPTAISIAVKKDFFEAKLAEQIERLDVNDFDDGSAPEAPAQTEPEEAPKAKAPAAKAKAPAAKKPAAKAAVPAIDPEDDDDLPF